MSRKYNETDHQIFKRPEPRGGARVVLSFDRGSLMIGKPEPDSGPPALPEQGTPSLTWDGRVGAFRCHAMHYRAFVLSLTRARLPYEDRARRYGDLPAARQDLPPPFPHQHEALGAWSRAKRGTVELPTGSGKTQLALMAIARAGREALVLAPTLDLVAQWCGAVERLLGIVPGAVGGGSFELKPVTVCTYASALNHAEHFGDRFGTAVFDECHHLAGEGYAAIALALIAPFRLGLSATLERPDGRHRLLDELIGPVVYAKGIGELSGRYLAEYQVRTVHAGLSGAERDAYAEARGRYLDFARARNIAMSSPGDWRRFVFAASRSDEGRAALDAYYRQKRIAFSAESKFQVCADLLHRHRGERVLIFTNDNATAYEVSRRFLLPIITHHTRVPERREILRRFRSGEWPFLVTSKVLNEGVDVPAAGVAVILSGNASVREHVQRLGRILRKEGDKQAVLYEVLTKHTAEESTSIRRRQHDAYR